MNNPEKIRVLVAREILEDDTDLPSFLDTVYEAILRNYQLFGAEDKFDLYPEVMARSYVVVYNAKDRSYTRATISIDSGNNVTFSEVEKVKRVWVPIDQSVERENREEFYPIEVARRSTTWGSLFNV